MRFTKDAIAELRIPKGRSELIAFDAKLPRFGVRLRAGGKRTWIVQYRIGSKGRRLTLGTLDVMDLATARAAAVNALAKVGLARDPQAEKLQAQAEASITLGIVIDRYLKSAKLRMRPRSFVEINRQLKRAWAPLHGQPIDQISRVLFAERLNAMKAENGPVAAVGARAGLSACYTWAMKEGLAAGNPILATNRPAKPRSRSRVLSNDEIVEIWWASEARDGDFEKIVRLLVLTLARRNEVSAIGWSEIDTTKAATWTLPVERSKNHREHMVPLSDPALQILTGIEQRHDRNFIFGAGAGGFSGWARSKAALDARIFAARKKTSGLKAKPMTSWTLHDLRRSGATRMADLGVAQHIIEAVLNHVSGSRSGIAGIYDRATYSPEKRSALNLWADHLMSITSSAEPRIIQLRQR